MRIFSISCYNQPNNSTGIKTGNTVMPQIRFQARGLTKDVISIAKKFEDLPIKEQRRTLFETFNNSPHFSFETLGNLMKFKDKSIPLIKEFYDITKNDGVFCEGLAFYDLDEEDLPTRIEFYKKYKEITPDETIRHDVNMLCAVNRYNLPLVELIGIKTNYTDDEIKLVQNTRAKEDANARIDAWKLVSELEGLSHGEEYVCSKRWLKGDKLNIISHTNKDNLPLLRKFRDHYKAFSDVPDAIDNVMRCTSKDNVKYKLKIFDAMEDFGIENDDVDILECTDNKNYPLVEYLLKDEDFPWDSISKVAENVKKEDCKTKIEIYESINKSKKSNFNWVSTTNIMYRTNSENIDLAKVLVEDKNIDPTVIEDILAYAQSKEQAEAKMYAYNTLKYREDVNDNHNDFATVLKKINTKILDLFNALASNPKFNLNNIKTIMSMERPYVEEMTFFIRMINNIPDSMTGEELSEIISNISHRNLNLAEKIWNNDYFPTEFKRDFLQCTTHIPEDINNLLCETGLKQLYGRYAEIKNTVYNNPEMYVNGEFDTESGMQDTIEYFFMWSIKKLMLASYIFDKKTLDDLLRMRFDYAEEYLEFLNKFERKDLEFLKTLCASKNPDGKPLSSKQKLDLPTIYKFYIDNNMFCTKIHNMAKQGIVNINELNSDLMNEIFLRMNINTSDIPEDKLLSWDTKYMHRLAQELEDSDYESKANLKAVINAANLKTSFKDFIQDPTNEFGYNNKATMFYFKELKMNYDKWVNLDNKNNVHFVYQDKNKEKLSQISDQIEEDINTLLHSMDEVVKSYDKNPIRKILYNSFGEYMEKEGFAETSDRFVIPANLRESKANLTKLVKALSDTSKEGAFTTVWNNAKNNINNPQRQERAKKTLMILNHLEQRLKDLENADRVRTQNLDLTIKMWDRVPQKDLFQGNYSTCCIGMGASNGWSMPSYLLNTVFNMIELVDNNTGEIVGNALCYFVKDDIGNPKFIIDNIEIKNSVKPSDKVGKELRNAIFEYAENIVRDVTGREDIQVLLGTNFNDVPDKDLSKTDICVSILGNINNDVYIDAIEYHPEWTTYNTLYKLVKK